MIDAIGYASGFILAFCLMPQIIKAYATKSTTDISILWNGIFIFGLLLYLVYVYEVKATPLLVAGIVETLSAIALITAKIIYG